LDFYYNRGEPILTIHHIVAIPKENLFTARMNSTDTTTGGYKGSEMQTITLPTVNNKLSAVLGNHYIQRYAIISSAVNTERASMAGNNYMGCTSNWSATAVYACLMSEIELYGATIFTSSYADIGEANQKLPLFNFINQSTYPTSSFWLRSVVNSKRFAVSDGKGFASSGDATHVEGVRPIITIG
jgi:hypothetical protein